MSMIVLTLVMAVSVEALVEYAKSIYDAFTGGGRKTAVTQMVAVAVSCLLCLTVGADVYSALGVTFSTPWVGMLLTGVFASRGANYFSDLVSKLQAFRAQ